jgi:hypothetical protein
VRYNKFLYWNADEDVIVLKSPDREDAVPIITGGTSEWGASSFLRIVGKSLSSIRTPGCCLSSIFKPGRRALSICRKNIVKINASYWASDSNRLV